MPMPLDPSSRPPVAVGAAESESARLSVVIPTRDRWPQLLATLAALDLLAVEATPLEVVVVDDGSTTVTPRPTLTRACLLWRRQAPRGPAAARNLGIAEASGRRVLLLGDDTRPAPGCLARHARAHGGLQGRIDWDPSKQSTAVMRFLAPEGPQFWFRGLRDGDELPATGVLGSNFSAPREWFELEPFDEAFEHAAFEDTELGWRFAQRGWRSRFSTSALCWHDHAYDSIEPFLEKQRLAGRAARRAVGLHPALAWKALGHPLLVYAAKLLRIASRAQPERSWELRCLAAYLAGVFGAPSSRSRPAIVAR